MSLHVTKSGRQFRTERCDGFISGFMIDELRVTESTYVSELAKAMFDDRCVSGCGVDVPMSAHTPGPWTAHVMTHAERGDLLTPDEIGEYVMNSVIKSALASETTEFVFVSAEKPDGHADVCHVGNGPTRAANARLIAAAPDLYLALLKLRRVTDLNDENEAAYFAAEAAIAKAEGR